MNIGVIGLGRMGHAIAYRLIKAGHHVTGFDPVDQARDAARAEGVEVVDSLADLAGSATIFWLMVPAGAVVDIVVQELLEHVHAGAIIIDGGNSHFTDSLRRATMLAQRSIQFLDCGTSGGLFGRDHGFSLMIGGDEQTYKQCEPLFTALAAPNGFGHVGPSGAGHYVKMVHNGIEYGLMQAYAEGFHLIKDGTYKSASLNLEQITRIWMHGAVVRSWLLELSHDIFKKDQQLTTVSGVVEESGTGRWTVDDARKHHIPVTVIEDALKIRAQSHTTGGNFATKVVALLRNAFGGHKVGLLEKRP